MERINIQRKSFVHVVIVSCIALVCLAMVLAAGSAKAEETEILKITVGEPIAGAFVERSPNRYVADESPVALSQLESEPITLTNR